MGAKKGRKPQDAQKKNQKAVMTDDAESDLSAVATASFIAGLQQNTDAPLHSTALEEDLSEETTEKQVKKKSTKAAVTPKGKEKEKKLKSTPQKSKKTVPVAKAEDQKKSVKRKSAGDVGTSRPVKNQKAKGKTKHTEPESGRSTDPEPQEPSDEDDFSLSRRGVFTSDEEENWEPSPKKLKVKGFGRNKPGPSSSDKSRKSSSGSGDEPEKRRERKKLKRSGSSQLEVVLEEFLDFCEQYKETVESNAVRKALDCFSSNVEDQLTEQISTSARLKTLTRENAKLASAIRTKRQRLLDAKNELIKSERKLWLLQKDKSELEQNLKDLTQGRTFLQNICELNSKYLKHRQKHPDEQEAYGASSLPALLIEAKQIQTTELQLKSINNRLQNALNEK